MTLLPGFRISLSLAPTSGSVEPGQSTTTTVHTVAGQNPAGDISLSASGAPSGVSVAFSPATVTPGKDATATVTVADSVAAGTYKVTVTGTAGQATHSADYTLTVGSPQTGDLTLDDPGVQFGYTGDPVHLALHASGGRSPYQWTASGLPTGLTIDPSSGLISGTPARGNTYQPTVKVTDAAGATRTVSFHWFVFQGYGS